MIDNIPLPRANREQLVRAVLAHIDPDADREGLADTPERVVRSWSELYGGYKDDPAKILEKDFDKAGYTGMVKLTGIEFYSTCEHHMQPFFGVAHIGYLPTTRVVGISKLARLVDCFARRLQIQERMTTQISEALETHLSPNGSAVIVQARHFCMVCRGVEKQRASMETNSLTGPFLNDPATRNEFMQSVYHSPR